ncbi:MAG: NAD(P)H-hydrate dehydratase [Firmicutes bacterium]|nr:NAD(P)H-hydrate dehydratase [Bacillota bacterium]
MKVADGAHMREIDRFAIEKLGIAGIVLMENASLAVCEKCIEVLGRVGGAKAAIFCGSGNNGGDGFAVARLLHCRGFDVTVLFLGSESKLKNDAKANYEAAKNIGIEMIDDFSQCKKIAENSDIIVDAMFGTGFKGSPKPPFDKVISIVNSSGKKVVSVDIPSGVNADNGHVETMAVRADETVTFVNHKCGTVLYPGAEYCGNVTVANISIPESVYKFVSVKGNIIDDKMACELIPKRVARSNKGTYGKLFVAAGSQGMSGAEVLCCKSAYKTGCGLVKAAAVESCAETLHTLVPEVVVKVVANCEGKFCKESFLAVEEDIKNATAIVIGPGIGRGAEVASFVERVAASAECHVLIDADGLNSISNSKYILKDMKKLPVITPHPGEFGRLTGMKVEDILKDTVGCAVEFAKEHNTVVLLKDARTVIAAPSGEYFINMSGNSSMAKGGSGDVLSGVIGSFLAMGMAPFEAAALGAYVHGLSGEMASERFGQYGVLASELADCVAHAVKRIANEKF